MCNTDRTPVFCLYILSLICGCSGGYGGQQGQGDAQQGGGSFGYGKTLYVPYNEVGVGIGSTVSVNPDFVQAFVTKLCMVAHHCEAECCVKRLVCYLQVQVHSGACKSNVTVLAVFS